MFQLLARATRSFLVGLGVINTLLKQKQTQEASLSLNHGAVAYFTDEPFVLPDCLAQLVAYKTSEQRVKLRFGSVPDNQGLNITEAQKYKWL